MNAQNVCEDWVDLKLKTWRQGDVSLDIGHEFMHLADMSVPHTPASVAAVDGADNETRMTGVVPVAEQVPGVVVLSQTCDIVRTYRNRPYLEIAPLVKLDEEIVEQVRRLKRPAFAYVPRTAHKGLVADLDRVMTVEKAVVAKWNRTPGWTMDEEIRAFAFAISRKRSRFAFPDDFVHAADRFKRHMIDKHSRQTPEGSHLRALQEIRVQAKPSWNHETVDLMFWFIKSGEPEGEIPEWSRMVEHWQQMIDEKGRFKVSAAIVCEFDDITARDYTQSDLLDLDALSTT